LFECAKRKEELRLKQLKNTRGKAISNFQIVF